MSMLRAPRQKSGLWQPSRLGAKWVWRFLHVAGRRGLCSSVRLRDFESRGAWLASESEPAAAPALPPPNLRCALPPPNSHPAKKDKKRKPGWVTVTTGHRVTGSPCPTQVFLLKFTGVNTPVNITWSTYAHTHTRL